MWEYLLNKKWQSDEFWTLLLNILVASIYLQRHYLEYQ